jgi:hypothetical protein
MTEEAQMIEPQQNTVQSPPEMTDLTRRGLALYESKLKPILEPERNNEFVAIHVDSEDYAVARSSGDAMRTLLARHPRDGRLVLMKIGPEPEYGLAARMLAGEMLRGSRK